MATTTYGTVSTTNILRGGLKARVAALRADYARWRTYRRTLDELRALDDRDLADLGLHRAALPGIAREAAYGA